MILNIRNYKVRYYIHHSCWKFKIYNKIGPYFSVSYRVSDFTGSALTIVTNQTLCWTILLGEGKREYVTRCKRVKMRCWQHMIYVKLKGTYVLYPHVYSMLVKLKGTTLFYPRRRQIKFTRWDRQKLVPASSRWKVYAGTWPIKVFVVFYVQWRCT
jgi:hypothetical protein